MKVLLFSPIAAESAVGRVATQVAHSMQSMGCEVSIVRTEAVGTPRSSQTSTHFPVVEWTDEQAVQALFEWADASVHHIGNSFDFHEGNVHWLEREPSVVCLHDFFLGHLFFGWANTHRLQAFDVLRRLYGENVANNYFVFNDPDEFIEGTLQVAPMTEWIAEKAVGVITHSAWGTGRVRQACFGEVRVVPLAYTVDRPVRFIRQDHAQGKFELITVGHVNRNKRAASVIQAIACGDYLRKVVTYHLVGPIDASEAFKLAALARNLDVRLRIHGAVDDVALRFRYERADAVACLRWPNLEAASASAIESLLHGKATIVLDTGFYQDLPDHVVIKLDPAREIPQLAAALHKLVACAPERFRIGSVAQAWATSHFTVDNYARELVAVLRGTAGMAGALQPILQFKQQLADWAGRNEVLHSPATWNPLLDLISRSATDKSG